MSSRMFLTGIQEVLGSLDTRQKRSGMTETVQANFSPGNAEIKQADRL